MEKWGIQVSGITDALRKQYSIDKEVAGVVVTEVDQASQIVAAGVREGDVIQEVNREPVKSIKDFNKCMKSLKVGDNAMFLIRRGQSTMYIAFTVKK